MTTRRPIEAVGVRSAISHVHVVERLQTPFGAFTLVEVTIETGRTHQIRVAPAGAGASGGGRHGVWCGGGAARTSGRDVRDGSEFSACGAT